MVAKIYIITKTQMDIIRMKMRVGSEEEFYVSKVLVNSILDEIEDSQFIIKDSIGEKIKIKKNK